MSAITEALAGFLSSSDSAAASRGGEKSAHQVFISTKLMPVALKLQREIRGRRFRDVQPNLKSAIAHVKAFEKDAWPPSQDGGTTTTASQTVANGSSFLESQLSGLDQADDASVATDVDDDTTITTVDATPEETADAERAATTWDIAIGEGQRLSAKEDALLGVPNIDDDRNTREPMHESMEELSETLIVILKHPSRTSRVCEITLECIQTVVSNGYFSGRAGGRDDHSGSGSEAIAMKEQGNIKELPPPSLLHRIMEAVASCSNYNSDTAQTAACRTFRILITSPKCGVHEGSLLLALRSAFHVYLVAKTPGTKDIAKASLIEMLRAVFGRLEEQELRLRRVAAEHNNSRENGTENGEKVASPMSSQYHTDGYVLFRALCKLSSKELPGDGEPESSSRVAAVFTSAPDPMALNNKVLSLELILAVMEFSGSAFCQGEKFIYLIQNYLCVGLLKNCMSNHTNVAFLSQKIFLLLLHKFKANLKQEIEVFLSNIFLRVLESPNSSFKQKALVLESLRSLCRDPVVLTQIFLNYDCDFDARNLYKDIVHHLTKLSGKSTSMPTANMTKKEVEEGYELSLAGVEVLVTILKAFLKALGLPGGDVGSDESAGERIRGMLSLDIEVLGKADDGKMSTDASVVAGDGMEEDTKLNMRSSTPPVSQNSLGSESSSQVAGKIVGAFEMKRNQEQNFQTGAIKFTLSLKSGLNFFIDNGFVECDAKEIAHFFLDQKDRLDKTQMGEVLGKEPDAAFVKGDNIDPEKGGPGFFVRILHHYASALEFTGIMFDDAVRLFLSGFRLPGEAQKIDRIMEKFAERFTLQNPEVFPSADTAFILGFSVIMLNTDLHNPSIKPEKKMTLESFIKNNRGISENGSDLPQEFLEGIFERIKKNPFSLKEDDDARERVATTQSTQLFDTSLFFEAPAFFGASAEERKRERFKKEREEMMAATTQLIRKRPAGKSQKSANESSSSRLMESVSPSDVVKPMFDVTWGPVIGILSQVLECSEDERSIAVCLNGFVYAIRLASHSHMSIARDTFVTSLAKFTFLGSIKEMKRKNIESIRTLLSIAVIDGEYLGESWGPVLRCTSQLARLRLSASGLDSDELFLSESDGIAKSRTSLRVGEQPGDARKTEESNGRAVLEAVNEVLIDKVFSNTVNLSAQSLAHFIEQLIEVSTAEINGSSNGGIKSSAGRVNGGSMHGGKNTKNEDGPSIFSLQKLVEVADFNMDVRPRLVWAQMWERMAEFFATISSHENTNVSVYAIDSLKQLSFKFLDKPELSEFNFQRIYLRPFLHVMQQQGTREDIRELVLRCLDNIVRTKSHNLRSGWKIIFAILARSAEDSSEKINFLGLAILQRLLDDHLDELCRMENEDDVSEEMDQRQHILPAFGERNRGSDVEDFVGLCRASSAFVQKRELTSPRPMGLSMRALCHTAIYADLLAEKRVQPPASGAQWADPQAPGYTYAGLDENEALEMVLWRTLLEGLADGVKSKAKSSAAGLGCLVQRGSVLALRAILIRHGSVFSMPQWEAILSQTLLPAIQSAAENEVSPVIGITSESPHLSSIDFLADSLPVPPPPDDPGLQKFAEVAMANENAPKRPFGKAELMLEASFTDMRHGGDGDLSRAYVLAQKDASSSPPRDQPFPDSWIATTAPLALGLLTDIVTEVFMSLGAEGRERLWPLISKQFLVWCVGKPVDVRDSRKKGLSESDVWWPCEAIARVACNELFRLPDRIASLFPNLYQFERISWTRTFLDIFSDALRKTVDYERSLEKDMFRAKRKIQNPNGFDEELPSVESPPPPVELKRLEDESNSQQSSSNLVAASFEVGSCIDTPFGKGKLVKKRRACYESSDGQNYVHLRVNEIVLDFGGTLYRPDPSSVTFKDSEECAPDEADTKPSESFSLDTESSYSVEHDNSFRSDTSRDLHYLDYVPALKVRCVAAHCLQNGFFGLFERLVPLMEKEGAMHVLQALKMSRLTSEQAVHNEELKYIFQEAIFTEWGDGVEEVEMALSNVARMSHLHGSDMFFLTQEAGATKATIQMLGMLYQRRAGEDRPNWDTGGFAESHLLGAMKEALRKFQDSEERDGHLIDPNVWRTTSESGGKVALYCTSFADVVVGILGIIHSLDHEKFTKHAREFFPIICSLVRAESGQIRNLVQRILSRQVAPMIGVDPEACTDSTRMQRESTH